MYAYHSSKPTNEPNKQLCSAKLRVTNCFVQFESQMTQGFASFAVSVAVNFLIAAAVFIFFGVFRKSKFVSKYYAPRRRVQ